MATAILFKKSSMLQVESASTPNVAQRPVLKWKTEVNSTTIRGGFNKKKRWEMSKDEGEVEKETRENYRNCGASENCRSVEDA